MKITTLFAAATIATASTAAYAGNPTLAGTADNSVIVLQDDDAAGSSAGSLGSLGGSVLPILAGLAILGVVAASDSGGGS